MIKRAEEKRILTYHNAIIGYEMIDMIRLDMIGLSELRC